MSRRSWVRRHYLSLSDTCAGTRTPKLLVRSWGGSLSHGFPHLLNVRVFSELMGIFRFAEQMQPQGLGEVAAQTAVKTVVKPEGVSGNSTPHT
jgi:hypothetical protein